MISAAAAFIIQSRQRTNQKRSNSTKQDTRENPDRDVFTSRPYTSGFSAAMDLSIFAEQQPCLCPSEIVERRSVFEKNKNMQKKSEDSKYSDLQQSENNKANTNITEVYLWDLYCGSKESALFAKTTGRGGKQSSENNKLIEVKRHFCVKSTVESAIDGQEKPADCVVYITRVYLCNLYRKAKPPLGGEGYIPRVPSRGGGGFGRTILETKTGEVGL